MFILSHLMIIEDNGIIIIIN